MILDIDNKKLFIYTSNNFDLLKNIPKIDDNQVYIYVMQNSAGNIKIGKTKNIQQRLKTLSGSNCGGAEIISLYCSPATWLHSIEKTCHNYFNFARISGEWFDGKKLDFKEVVKYVDSLFYTKSYEVCNKMRENLAKQK